MRKMLFVIALALLAMSAAAQVVSDDIDLEVTLLNQDPDPVEPGQYADLRFSLENNGDVAARNVKVELIQQEPFSLDAGEQSLFTIGTLGALQRDAQAMTIKYRIRVARDAFEGENKLELRISYTDSNNRQVQFTKEFDINIRTLDEAIGIESITSYPGMLEPGKNGELEIKIKNLADSSLRQVSVKLDLTLSSLASAASAASATGTASGQSLLDLIPVASIGSGTEKRIPRLEPGEEKTIEYQLAVYPDAESGVYKIPLIVSFYNYNNTLVTSNELVGLKIGSEPELDVVLDSYDVITPGTTGEVTMKFINKGVSNIKFVTVKLNADDDHKVLSADSDYIGNIDSDDFQTSDFTIYVEPTATERISLPVHVTYKDANNNDYTMDTTLYATMYTEAQAKQLGIQQQSFWPILLVVIVVIVGGFIAFRWFKGRKR